VDTLDDGPGDMEIKTNLIIEVLNALNQAGFNLPGNIMELKNYQNNPLKTS
jgi:hypothetical protein